MGENIHECTDVLLQCEECNEILYTTEAFTNTLLHICANAGQNNNKSSNLGRFKLPYEVHLDCIGLLFCRHIAIIDIRTSYIQNLGIPQLVLDYLYTF